MEGCITDLQQEGIRVVSGSPAGLRVSGLPQTLLLCFRFTSLFFQRLL